jgi:hypothetical protein
MANGCLAAHETEQTKKDKARRLDELKGNQRCANRDERGSARDNRNNRQRTGFQKAGRIPFVSVASEQSSNHLEWRHFATRSQQ